MKRFFTFLFVFLMVSFLTAQENEKKKEKGTILNRGTTIFKFGGYIKADFIHSWYMNGDVGPTSPLRDFHLPSQIPIGDPFQNYDLDFHVKESRFNFDVNTKVLGKEIHGFVEMDFLLSGTGDERVSNSFNPRLRHFYVEWDRFLFGQTWSTFMVVVVPDEIDFAGAMDGLVFIRQPQIRFKLNSWWFALENPETTITPYEDKAVIATESEFLPDVVIRKNFKGNWGNWSIAGIYRSLNRKDSVNHWTSGFGLTTGGKLLVGKRGDDFRIMATGGYGLGRYLSGNFVASSIVDESGKLIPTPTLNGYVAYNHFWKPARLSSSFSIAAFNAFYSESVIGKEVNKASYSISGNIKWDIVPVLRLGLEYMYGYRETLNGTNGSFHRIQAAVKYTFGYHNEEADEKK